VKKENKQKFYYIWRLCLCLLPFVGGLIGLVFFINGLKTNNKKIIVIGAIGMTFTVCLFTWMVFYSRTESFNGVMEETSQKQLNRLVKHIENYKSLNNGKYPASLKQLSLFDDKAPIYDPIQGNLGRSYTLYGYKNLNNKYSLFSFGRDGISNTKDDLFPSDTVGSGWVNPVPMIVQ